MLQAFRAITVLILLGGSTLPAQNLPLGAERPPLEQAAYRNRFGKLPQEPLAGDRMVAESLRLETQQLAARSLQDIESLADWEAKKPQFRRQLLEMLGLDPLPPRSDLKATITGTIERDGLVVERLHFQSRPGLYVTANLYRPKQVAEPLPAVLYVCGHGQVKIDGISYGNKVNYQHHGAWFARNGYVCLIIDSVQLGEIEGIHHGTHREGMWWWNSRGYTAAGAEAWNCVRALDYLQSRPEVDGKRLGVTGRSGGGAYAWWIATIDERIQAACPVAGITDLQNHVVDGCVEGHCDCMFMVNLYRWDYEQVAALVAPRPLLILNTDKDSIFPLSGVVRLHAGVRRIYDFYDAPEKLGLVITEGPHKDTQELQLPVMRWFNRWLKRDETPVANYAEKLFEPAELKVLSEIPADEITSRCYENFTVLADDQAELQPAAAIAALREKTFGAWPDAVAADGSSVPAASRVAEFADAGLKLTIYDLQSSPAIGLRLYCFEPTSIEPTRAATLEILDEPTWGARMGACQGAFGSILQSEHAMLERSGRALRSSAGGESSAVGWLDEVRKGRSRHILFAPRGIGLSALSAEPKYLTHLRRRFMLLGTTLASMQVWDCLQAARQTLALDGGGQRRLRMQATTGMTEVVTLASLFSPQLDALVLQEPPRDELAAPDFLAWRRIITPQQLLQLAQQRTMVQIEP
jgi:dienelactone hydrolase